MVDPGPLWPPRALGMRGMEPNDDGAFMQEAVS